MNSTPHWQSTLDELARLIPHPVGGARTWTSWAEAEDAIGLRLPDDYKAFSDLYGGGEVNLLVDLFSFRHPLVREIIDNVLKVPLQMQRNFPDEYPVPFFPKPGGLLPFATTSNGEDIHWATNEGDPNDWRVVFHDPLESELGHFDGCFVEFLMSALNGAPECAAFFPRSFAERPVSFVPWSPESAWTTASP